MSITVYKTFGKVQGMAETELDQNIQIRLWEPSLTRIIPPLLGWPYFFRWFAHFFGIFKNKHYSAVVAYNNNTPISIMVVIPAYSRWRFMSNSDVHFTSLVLHPEYRGAGIAYHVMKFGVEKFSSDTCDIWTIVRDENKPARKLIAKVGFSFYSKAIRRKRFGLSSIGEVVLVTK